MVSEHHMGVVIITVAFTFILLGVGFAVVFVRLISRDRTPSAPDESEALFSPTRYRAMERLLTETDQKFIASHPFFTPQLEKKLRQTRIKSFRGYVRMLADDFNQICKAIRVLMVTYKVDRSDLAGLLMKQQFLLAVGMMHVEFKLILYSFGWAGVDVSGLVHSLDAMRVRLQSLAAVALPSAA